MIQTDEEAVNITKPIPVILRPKFDATIIAAIIPVNVANQRMNSSINENTALYRHS